MIPDIQASYHISAHHLYSRIAELWELRDAIYKNPSKARIEEILLATYHCFNDLSFTNSHEYLLDHANHCMVAIMKELGFQILEISKFYQTCEYKMQSLYLNFDFEIQECIQELKPNGNDSIIPQITTVPLELISPENFMISNQRITNENCTLVDNNTHDVETDIGTEYATESVVSSVASESDFDDYKTLKKTKLPYKNAKLKINKKRVGIPRPNYPLHVTKILQKWLREHQKNPYPNDSEKKELCDATDLSVTQLNNWFINARRRYL